MCVCDVCTMCVMCVYDVRVQCVYDVRVQCVCDVQDVCVCVHVCGFNGVLYDNAVITIDTYDFNKMYTASVY